MYKKAQDHKDSVKAEIQERNKVTEEISAVTNALENAASVLLQDADGKAEQLEVGNSSKPLSQHCCDGTLDLSKWLFFYLKLFRIRI